MPRRQPVADGLDRTVQRFDDMADRLLVVEKPDGNQLNRSLEKVQQLILDLPGLITAALAAGFTSATGLITGNFTVNGPIYSPHALANSVTSGYFALYINGDGRIGKTVSARKYKQDIQSWVPEWQALFAVHLVTYRLKAAVKEFGDNAPAEWGVIAEELHELGLTWLVIYGPGGAPEGVAYEKIGAALLPVVQDHEKRIVAQGEALAELEARVAKLES